ncbi:LRPAP1 [Cordylochernes scorpioides]|uniref:LRPAP1 n=1 Tax=Cordylochernes scorpioides TaxID=51811 RepID=A0ABY6LV86_9ARAC|nr:LRPAP1 [Cordylochernes scorpioides]
MLFYDMDENIKITENDNTILGGLEDANKNMFKDKKLNKLWIKAQKSGFSNMIQNSLHSIGSEDLIQSSHSRIQEKHKELRENFEYLSRQVLLGDFQFEEPEVEQLWKLAQKANFTGPELESLREELHHYENRLKKLQIFKSDIDGKISVENPEHHQFKEKRLQDYERKKM